jgi:hypothetical protein
MAIDVKVGGGGGAACMVSVAVPLIPLADAVMVEVPAATPVANPEEAIVATVVVAEVQVAVVVMSAVVPSLYTAVAANCWVAPMTMLAVFGDALIAVMVFTGNLVAPHPATKNATLTQATTDNH